MSEGYKAIGEAVEGVDIKEDLRERYTELKRRYREIRTRLQSLVIQSEELQRQIRGAEEQLQEIDEQFGKIKGEQPKLESVIDPEKATEQERNAAIIQQKLHDLEMNIRSIWSKVMGGESFDRPVEPVREKTPMERMRDDLNTKKAEKPVAKQFHGKTISELIASFEELEARAESLKIVGAWMIVMTSYRLQLESALKTHIMQYQNCLTDQSTLSVSIERPDELERRTSALLGSIALELYSYHVRVELLEVLEKQVHQIILNASKNTTFSDLYNALAEEIENMSQHMSHLLTEAISSKDLVAKSPGADAFVRIVTRDVGGPQGPKSIKELVDMMTVYLLHGVMKRDDENRLTKKDVKQLVVFFHPDKFGYKIDGLGCDPSIKKNLRDAIASIYKIASEVYESGFFDED